MPGTDPDRSINSFKPLTDQAQFLYYKSQYTTNKANEAPCFGFCFLSKLPRVTLPLPS